MKSYKYFTGEKHIKLSKFAFTLAEVFYPAEKSKRIASRIIRAVAGVTSRSISGAWFAVAHTALLSHNNSLDCCVRQSRKFGFTLAEILITLGIIGVVAALTMPVLINNIQDKDLESRYNKAKNMLTNGYKLMTVKEDMESPYDLFLSVCGDEPCLSKYHNKYFKILKDSQNGLSLDNLAEEYSIKGQEDKSSFKWSDVEYAFTTNDGFIYGLIPDDDNQTFSIVTDVNNKNKPNTVKRDLYKFRFDDRGVLADVSDEFEVGLCSAQNPLACNREQCNAIKPSNFNENHNCYETKCAWWEYGEQHCYCYNGCVN